jgi:hypothetical protein
MSIEDVAAKYLQNNLYLTYDVEPHIPDQLIGDSLRLCQVTTNLVFNTIKFTPSKLSRKRHVAMSTCLLALDNSSVRLDFCVMDTGIGIAKDKRNLIFDTFCQAYDSTTRVRFLFRYFIMATANTYPSSSTCSSSQRVHKDSMFLDLVFHHAHCNTGSLSRNAEAQNWRCRFQNMWYGKLSTFSPAYYSN